MAITLSQRYLNEIKKCVNAPNAVIELFLDGSTRRFGYHSRNGVGVTYFRADGAYKADGWTHAIGGDDLDGFGVEADLKSVSSFQNKLDAKKGYSTRGEISFVIAGRDNFKSLISDNYLKNRRVAKKEGFISQGFTYADYATTYVGMVTDWSRNGDELTVTVSDDLVDASIKIPTENEAKTQYIDYRNVNPADIMRNILSVNLGVGGSYIDLAKFASERDTWLNGWKYSRVITDSKEANEYLNELQVEANSYLFHDGDKISLKVFAPPVPSQSVEEWTEEANIIKDSFRQKSGYKDNFYNRVVLYYDYDESGSSDSADYYDSAVIAVDSASQDSTEWDEASTKTVYSKWIRSTTFSQTANITGVFVYHASKNNGAGTGTLAFTYDAANGNTLQWTPPGGTIGEAVKITKDGKFDVYGSDSTRFIRVLVTTASLPASGAADTVTITPLDGDKYALAVAQKILSRFRDPASTVSFDIDINCAAFGSTFIRPTDVKDVTTGEACEKGKSSWTRERLMLTSVKPDVENGKVAIEAMVTRFYRQYGFIAPAGLPDYGSANDAQRKYAYVGRSYVW